MNLNILKLYTNVHTTIPDYTAVCACPRALSVLPPVGLSTVFEADKDPRVKMSHVNFTVLHNML